MGAYRLAGCLLYITGTCFPLDLNPALIKPTCPVEAVAKRGPPYTGDVRTVVWEGRSVMGVPIPISSANDQLKILFNFGFNVFQYTLLLLFTIEIRRMFNVNNRDIKFINPALKKIEDLFPQSKKNLWFEQC